MAPDDGRDRDPNEAAWIVWSPEYEVDIGPHVFPTRKYRLVRDRLLEEGEIRESEIRPPEPASDADLRRVHDEAWLEKIRRGDLTPAEELRLEVPFSEALREAMVLCCGGSTAAGRIALRSGVGVHLGGGFHHAFADHGEGFCLLNDVAVAVRALQAGGAAGRVAVVDLDVHHGNGTAAIFRDDGSVFTFSMHQERNYPSVKPEGDLDVPLPDGVGDDGYLERLDDALDEVIGGFRPELAFYLAGADPYREDQLGGLGLTIDGLRERDRRVLGRCREAGVPVAVTLAGGYAIREADTVEIHRATVLEARAARGGRADRDA